MKTQNNETRLLLSCEELGKRLNSPEITLVDLRGEPDYNRAHVPGAVNLPANELHDPDSPGNGLLPIARIAEILGQSGIGDAGTLILYDENGLVPSARLFWILSLLGRGAVSLLNGGIPAWRAAGLPLETEAGSPAQPVTFTPAPRESVLARREDVLQALQRQDVAIVDARSAEEYQGHMQTATRNGHIPGAINLNWENHIRDLFDPTFQPEEQLRELYERAGVTPDKEVIVYCRSGARSSSTFFVLTLLGYPRVRNYVGSWLEWGNAPDVPIE